MRNIFFLLIAASFVAACSSTRTTTVSTDASTAQNENMNIGQPVETRQPNTTYQPAFPGQTRIGSVTTTTAYSGTVINSTLTRPWGLAALPDGRLLITEKGGTMRIATTAGQIGEAITGLPPVNARGQGGLLGVTVDPQFASNRMVYWVFSDSVAEGNVTAVAKGTLSADERKMEGVSIIYRATPAYAGALHYGGRILVDREGNLIVSTGERSDLVTRPQAQDINSGLGKIIRITKDGQPAAGNPLGGTRPEIYSYGHRNVQGIALHPESGELWETEMGPRGGDELNRVERGKNYGWPVISYGLEYNGQKVGAGITQQAGMEQPVYYWDPVLSPSGMAFYTGNAVPEWKNNLFIAGLNSKHIARIVLANNKVVGEERILATEDQRFRDVTMGKDDALYAVTDGGRLYRIAKK